MADKWIGDHGYTKSHTADEELEANRFVKLVTATGLQPHCVYADAGELACGAVFNKFLSGQRADVVKTRTVYVMTAENIAANQLVSAAADGKAAVSAGGNYILGIAQTDANSGSPVLVLLGIGGVV